MNVTRPITITAAAMPPPIAVRLCNCVARISTALPPSVVIVGAGLRGSTMIGTPVGGVAARTPAIAANADDTSESDFARAAGSFASSLPTSDSSCGGTSARSERSAGGVTVRCFVYASGIVLHSNGGRPIASSNITQPSE